MFNFIVKYCGFLKHIPLLAHVFDSWLKITTLFSNRNTLNYIDDIENEVLSWKNTSVKSHKFGGIQFNLDKRELGHIHSNGLVDVLFNREIKAELLREGRIKEHHLFKDSGWISFQVQTLEDKKFAVELLRKSYIKSQK